MHITVEFYCEKITFYYSSRNVTGQKFGGECPSEVASCYATDVDNWNETMADRCRDMGCYSCDEVRLIIDSWQ